MMWRRRSILFSAVTAAVIGTTWPARMRAESEEPSWQAFLEAANSDQRQAQTNLADIAARWKDGYAAMILDVVRFLPSPRTNQMADQGPPLLDSATDEQRAGATPGQIDSPSMARSSPEAATRRRLTNFGSVAQYPQTVLHK